MDKQLISQGTAIRVARQLEDIPLSLSPSIRGFKNVLALSQDDPATASSASIHPTYPPLPLSLRGGASRHFFLPPPSGDSRYDDTRPFTAGGGAYFERRRRDAPAATAWLDHQPRGRGGGGG